MAYRLIREFFFWLGVVAMATLVYVISSSVWWSTSARARVIDAESKLPVRDAVVLANWELKGLEGYVMEQIAFFETATDVDGAFTVPGWGPRFRLSGTVYSNQPKVHILHRDYLPAIVRNRPKEPWGRLRRIFIQHPSVDGQTIELQPFHGSLAQYSSELEFFLLSIDFLYSSGNCEWQRAPRTVIELHKLKSELQGGGNASQLFSLDNITETPKCGSARELLKGYLR